jgi:adenylate cyclase
MDLKTVLHRPPKVLVADDDRNIREILELYLETSGCRVYPAANGNAAMEILEKEAIDLALIDIELPGMTGLEVCRAVKENPRTRTIPVMIVTAHTSERLEAIDSGADEFLGKPIQSVILLTRARSLLRLRALHLDLEERNVLLRHALRRYVSDEVAETILSQPERYLRLGGETRLVTVLFADIKGFSRFTENHSAGEAVEALNRIFAALTPVIFRHQGTFDKFIGDAVMAFFGAPVKGDDALKSVLAGLDMTEALTAVNARRVKAGKRPFHVSVGINRGYVTVGTIGTEQKMDYTVIGDPVNLASRLSGLTRIYRQDLLFSESLHRSVSDQVPCRLVDSVAVKGRREGVKIFTAKRAVSGNEKQAWDMHNAAMEEYYNRNFGNAIALFGHVLKILPGDYPAGLIMQRCRLYQQEPPPPGWDGVEAMRTK